MKEWIEVEPRGVGSALGQEMEPLGLGVTKEINCLDWRYISLFT